MATAMDGEFRVISLARNTAKCCLLLRMVLAVHHGGYPYDAWFAGPANVGPEGVGPGVSQICLPAPEMTDFCIGRTSARYLPRHVGKHGCAVYLAFHPACSGLRARCGICFACLFSEAFL